MPNLTRRLWDDDRGAMLSAEWLLVMTVLILGLITALVAVRQAINSELTELSNALLALNPSYSFSGQGNCQSATAGSAAGDFGDRVPRRGAAAVRPRHDPVPASQAGYKDTGREYNPTTRPQRHLLRHDYPGAVRQTGQNPPEGGAGAPDPSGYPGNAPTAGTHASAAEGFDEKEFWDNVEKLEPGLRDWWQSQMRGEIRQRYAGWLSPTTLKFRATYEDGRWIVHLHNGFDEIEAAKRFVEEVTNGFFAEYWRSRNITNPNKDGAKELEEFQKWWLGEAARTTLTGARLLGTFYSLAFKGADWIITLNDVVDGADPSSAYTDLALLLARLPLAKGGKVQIKDKAGKLIHELEYEEAKARSKSGGAGPRSVNPNVFPGIPKADHPAFWKSLGKRFGKEVGQELRTLGKGGHRVFKGDSLKELNPGDLLGLSRIRGDEFMQIKLKNGELLVMRAETANGGFEKSLSRLAETIKSGGVEKVIHTHPGNNFIPTKADARFASWLRSLGNDRFEFSIVSDRMNAGGVHAVKVPFEEQFMEEMLKYADDKAIETQLGPEIARRVREAKPWNPPGSGE